MNTSKLIEELGVINESFMTRRGAVCLKAQITEYNGRRSLSLRGFYTNANGEQLPSDTGINLNFKDAEAVADMLVELYQRPDVEQLFVADSPKDAGEPAKAKVTVKEVAAATEKRMNDIEAQNKILTEQNSQMMAMMQQLLAKQQA